MPLSKGVYPASVTPFDRSGKPDAASLAKLMAYFESAGCRGVVLAGTNGEGPSLSAYEKRDLVRSAMACRGGLQIILGIATPSLDEARWLCTQAHKEGADAVLVMPPGYFRTVSEDGLLGWFNAVLNSSPLPVIAYNFPRMTGLTLSAEFIGKLASHSRLAGVKDSSGDRSNLADYRAVLGEDHRLYVGDETLLLEALQSGWSGSISGAANLVPRWLAQIVHEWAESDKDATTRFQILVPVIEAIRKSPQPVSNKAALHALGVIDNGEPRLPLTAVDPSGLLAMLKEKLGIRPGSLGLDRSSLAV